MPCVKRRLRLALAALAIGAVLLAFSCNKAFTAFEKIRVGQSLAGVFPDDAVQTALGVAYCEQEGDVMSAPDLEIKMGQCYQVRALVGDDGKVLSKSYTAGYRQSAQGKMAEARCVVLDVRIPDDWWRDSPKLWSRQPSRSQMADAWEKVKSRIQWKPATTMKDIGGPAAPGDSEKITSTAQLIDSLAAAIRSPNEVGPDNPSRHVALYLLLASLAMDHLPANLATSEVRSPRVAAFEGLSRLVAIPGAFATTREPSAEWKQQDADRSTFRVQNLGGNVVRVEMTLGRYAVPLPR
jgi:hypothetical protein